MLDPEKLIDAEHGVEHLIVLGGDIRAQDPGTV